jgi:NADH:ubiquinone oxidoreductase subunit 5 (subunit L)/multisubunit Na+/H+ antiporter MnhA subunit
MKKDMGGLWRKMPITFVTFVIATLALAGVPPLAGFFSKDEIIDSAGHNGYTAFQIVGLTGAFLTAAYMTRCVYLTFLGQPRGASAGLAAHGDEEHEIDDDRVLVDARLASPSVARHELIDTPAEGALAEGEVPEGPGHGAHDAPGAHDAHGDHRGPHESNWLITVPLVVLGVQMALEFKLRVPPREVDERLSVVDFQRARRSKVDSFVGLCESPRQRFQGSHGEKVEAVRLPQVARVTRNFPAFNKSGRGACHIMRGVDLVGDE